MWWWKRKAAAPKPAPRPDKVQTVADMRELLRDSEDDEPLILKYDDAPEGAGYLACTGASSSGGGTITILWFRPK